MLATAGFVHFRCTDDHDRFIITGGLAIDQGAACARHHHRRPCKWHEVSKHLPLQTSARAWSRTAHRESPYPTRRQSRAHRALLIPVQRSQLSHQRIVLHRSQRPLYPLASFSSDVGSFFNSVWHQRWSRYARLLFPLHSECQWQV
jgi:hypothetical protein